MKLILLILCFSCSITIQAQPDISLRLQANKSYMLRTSNEQQVIQILFGDSVRTKHTEEATFRFKVVAVEDSGYAMQMQFERLAQGDSSAKGVTFFSTDPGDTSGLSLIMSRMLYKPFEITIQNDFKITRIAHADTLLSGIFNGMNIPEENKNAIRAQFATELDWTIKNSTGSLNNLYPPHAATKQNMWTVFVENQFTKGQQDTVQYQLEENALAYIISAAGTSISTLAMDSTSAPSQKVAMAGRSHTTVHLSKRSGWILKAQIANEMKGDFMESKDGLSLLIPTILHTQTRLWGEEPAE